MIMDSMETLLCMATSVTQVEIIWHKQNLRIRYFCGYPQLIHENITQQINYTTKNDYFSNHSTQLSKNNPNNDVITFIHLLARLKLQTTPNLYNVMDISN